MCNLVDKYQHSSQKLIPVYKATQRHIPVESKYLRRPSYCCEILKY
jgi:hypothetical protein